MHGTSFLAGSWHVVRLPNATQHEQDRRHERFLHTLISAYEAAGAPSGFEVYRSAGPRSLYAYLSPGAVSAAATGLERKGFKLVPLRKGFDIESLPVNDVDRLLPEA
jgi:hypothetical protein